MNTAKIEEGISLIKSLSITKGIYLIIEGAREPGKLNGINVHFGQEGNKDYTKAQIDPVIKKAKLAGFNSFRNDINTLENGEPKNPACDPFMKAAKAEGMPVMVILYLSHRGDLYDEAKNVHKTSFTAAELDMYYRDNYRKGRGFAKLYPHVMHYQLDNELDVKDKSLTDYAKDPYGRIVSTLGEQKLPGYLAMLNGLFDGIKSVTPKAETCINYSWFHTGIIDKIADNMEASGRKVDIIGIDTYNDQEYNKDPKGMATLGRMAVIAKEKFPNYKIYVTEYGFYPSKANPNKLTQAGYLKVVIPFYRRADGMFMYQALDEAGSRTGDEAKLGLTNESLQMLF